MLLFCFYVAPARVHDVASGAGLEAATPLHCAKGDVENVSDGESQWAMLDVGFESDFANITTIAIEPTEKWGAPFMARRCSERLQSRQKFRPGLFRLRVIPSADDVLAPRSDITPKGP